jgi:hypothetical protein
VPGWRLRPGSTASRDADGLNLQSGQRFTVGCRESGGSDGAFWNGGIGEIIVRNADVSSGEREILEGYLAHKWGLAGSLHASHPYKTNPPPQ